LFNFRGILVGDFRGEDSPRQAWVKGKALDYVLYDLCQSRGMLLYWYDSWFELGSNSQMVLW